MTGKSQRSHVHRSDLSAGLQTDAPVYSIFKCDAGSDFDTRVLPEATPVDLGEVFKKSAVGKNQESRVLIVII